MQGQLLSGVMDQPQIDSLMIDERVSLVRGAEGQLATTTFGDSGSRADAPSMRLEVGVR